MASITNNGNITENDVQDPASRLSELDLLVMNMQNGSKMMKVDKKLRRTMKVFTLDKDLLGFHYKPTKKIHRVEIKCIESVSLTPTAKIGPPDAQVSPENCFTVEFVETMKRGPLVVVATEKRIAQCWVRGLNLLVTEKELGDNKLHPRRKWLFDQFDKYDKNNSGTMQFKEFIQIMASFNIPLTKETLLQKFQEFKNDSHKCGQQPGLTKTEFAAFFESVSKRKDIQESVITKYSSNGTYLTSEELLEFLKNSQKIHDASADDCQRIVESYEMIDGLKSEKCLSVDGFLSYLLSKEGDLFNAEQSELYQDMNQPLCHYFISSSHNTYCEGDQLQGKASVEAYVSALKMGCRCVELDCWDGDDFEPVIYHGHTLVNKILFKDVMQAVNENAFVASPYPLILSLENHCSVAVQKKMAQYIKEILGDKLHTAVVDAELQCLPSPEFFKNKIIVKGKTLPASDTVKEGEAGEVSEEEEEDIPQLDAEGNVLPAASGAEQKNKKVAKKRKIIKLAPELSNIVNYCTAVRFPDLAKCKKQGKFFHMSSVGETKTKKLVKDKCSAFIEYNKKQLSRIYPAGSRIHSSNYNPLLGWKAGCQIVALNFQTEGEMMDLYLGKFQQNGNSGYVLKPEYMRNASAKATLSRPVNFTVKIISGQQFPKISGCQKGEIVDPYVTVTVYENADERTVFKTRVINNNGFNPRWNETFEFKVKNPELALVRFVVYDYDVGSGDDFIGQFSLPFLSIDPGFRHITLNGHGTKSLFPASLFVYVDINKL